MPGSGFSWQVDPKYLDILVSELGLASAKELTLQIPRIQEREIVQLTKNYFYIEEAIEFRRLAGTALYLSLDRPSI